MAAPTATARAKPAVTPSDATATDATERAGARALAASEPAPLVEYADSRGASVRLDKRGSVLHGVKLLGLTSRNGRRYREAALRKAARLYEGARVNVNHPPGDPLAPRDYRDRIGAVRNVELRSGEGLFASLHFNPKHPLAEQLVWDAEHAPQNVGFSHNVIARTSRDSHGVVVDAIQRVRSVDLVADPATTAGLFEHETDRGESRPPSGFFSRLTVDLLERHRPDLVESLLEAPRRQADEAARRCEELSCTLGATRRRLLINELLVEHGLPLPGARVAEAARVTSDVFLHLLTEAPDDAAVGRLVADRARAIAGGGQSGPVVSREQAPPADRGAAPGDSAGFVAAITSRG